MNSSQPWTVDGLKVLPDYIDANGHMNVGYYNVIFDIALDKICTPLDLSWEYVKNTNQSTFVLETHVCYLQEVVEGDPLRFTWQLLGHDAKRIHYFMQMLHAEKGYVAATSEQILTYVDLTTRKTAPFPEAHQARFREIYAGHSKLPVPRQVGRVIGIPKKQTAA